MRPMSGNGRGTLPLLRQLSGMAEGLRPYIAAFLIIAVLLSLWAGLCAA